MKRLRSRPGTTLALSSSTYLVIVVVVIVLCSIISTLWSLGHFTSLSMENGSANLDPSFIVSTSTSTSTATTTTFSSSKDTRNFRIPPLIAQRTMYTAGYDARVTVQPSANPSISWQWTTDTETYFAQLYNSVMNPQQCNTIPKQQGQSSIRILKQHWGLGSRIRDTVDIMFAAMDVNRTVLHGGTTTDCPILTLPPGNNHVVDPYMNCLYQRLSHCQGISPIRQLVEIKRSYGLFHDVPAGILVPNRKYTQTDIDNAIHRWWQQLVQHGLHAVQYPDPVVDDTSIISPVIKSSLATKATTTSTQQRSSSSSSSSSSSVPNILSTPPPASLDEKYSVLRALMAQQVFSPSKVTPWVQQRVEELELAAAATAAGGGGGGTSGGFLPPTLVVHLRRTDKADDEAIMYPHEQRATFRETLVIVRALIRAATRLSNLQFQSIFFMSDEPQAYTVNHTRYLSATLPHHPTVFFNDFVVRTLGNHTEYQSKGHEIFLKNQQHDIMDRELAADMSFAAKHAAYVIGYGRSGVSQLLAQLIGARQRICPSQVSLFEDDMVLLQHLEETKDWYWYINGK
jgi:hypothetical protein